MPVEKDLEFPCEKTTLYGTYNPFNVDKALSPPATKGKFKLTCCVFLLVVVV